VLEGPQPSSRWKGTEARLSVDGYEKASVYAFEPPRGLDTLRYQEWLARAFYIWADYSVQQVPTLYTIGNIVFIVNGIDPDTQTKVLTSLWHMRPTGEVTPFGIPKSSPSVDDKQEAEAAAVGWFTDAARGADAFNDVTGVEARLVMFGDYVARFLIEDPLHTRLPHPDTAVWLVEVREGKEGIWARRYGAVVLDYFTGTVVHAYYGDRPPALYLVPQIPVPGPIQLVGRDGDLSDYDELSTVIAWERPRESVVGELQLESVNTYVVERSNVVDGSWEKLALVSSAGWDVRIQRPEGAEYPPPARVALLNGEEIWFWDWAVVDGQRYHYRVYGCTWLGRKTSYSNVVSAVAGDPVPDTPHGDPPTPATGLVPPCE